jgi:hypothetical protein
MNNIVEKYVSQMRSDWATSPIKLKKFFQKFATELSAVAYDDAKDIPSEGPMFGEYSPFCTYSKTVTSPQTLEELEAIVAEMKKGTEK